MTERSFLRNGEESIQDPDDLMTEERCRRSFAEVLRIVALHCRAYMARRAWFVFIVKSAPRNFSTLLP
jgi:hypothetical protein